MITSLAVRSLLPVLAIAGGCSFTSTERPAALPFAASTQKTELPPRTDQRPAQPPKKTAAELEQLTMVELSREGLRKDLGDDYRTLTIDLFGRKRRWRAADIERVLNREIWIGANMDQVGLAWGMPDRSSTNHYDGLDVDNWHYGSIHKEGPIYHVTFKNGVLDSWSEQR